MQILAGFVIALACMILCYAGTVAICASGIIGMC